MVSRSKENLTKAVDDISKSLNKGDINEMVQLESVDLSDIEAV